MGDRRPFSFLFRLGNRARANKPTTPAPTTTTPPPPTTTPAPTTTTTPTSESQPIGRLPITTTLTSVTPPPTETQTPVSQQATTTDDPPTSSITPPTTEGQESNRPDTIIPNPTTLPTLTEAKTDNQPTTTTTNHDVHEHKTSSPSREITKPPSSPSRRTTQSRSPPQPSSPSRIANQPRSTPSSPSRMKTPSTPHPRPLSRSSSRRSPNKTPSTSTNGTQLTSPSKEPRQSSQEIPSSYEATTSSHDEKDLNPGIAQQESHLKAEVESDSANEINDSQVDGKRFKQDDDQVMPSKPSQLGTTIGPAQSSTTSTPTKNLDSSIVDGENDPLIVLNANPEETKDVTEVVETTNTAANGEMKKEVNDFLTPISESEIIVKQAAIDEKEILAASRPTVRPTNSQPKKRNNIAGTHKDIKDDISTFVNRMAIGDPQSTIYGKPVSIITVAGENRGASMHVGSNSSKREGSIHIHRSYKINPDESNAESTTDGERSSMGDEKSEHAKGTEDQPTTDAYINNNAQGINNSIVFNTSISERNPGVHMVVTHVPKELTESSTYSTSPLDSQKSAQVSMTRTEKLIYEPTVRRRCLRGLMLESSDSDPEKPRRHGCRVGCPQRGTKNDIDVL